MKHLLALLVVGCVTLNAVFTSAAERPNILFAIADDWSFGHAGAYDCSWVETPNFDRLAREGILFLRAIHAECQVRTVPGNDPYRSLLLAVGRGR